MNIYLADLSTLIQKKKMRLFINNRSILLTIVDGLPYAIQDKCPHRGSSLFTGSLEKDIITCKEHGLGVSVITGKVTDIQKAEFLNVNEDSREVRTFITNVIAEKVYIEM